MAQWHTLGTAARLSDVTPSALAALGVGGFANRCGLPDARAVAVLLVDGLGAELLDAHAADAPTLARLRSGVLEVGFPSTTAAGLAAIGTGTTPGEHGIVGYTFDVPGAGVLHTLRWRDHHDGADLRGPAPPERVQARATVFEQAVDAGIACRVVSAAKFADTGMTRAALRGGRYHGVHAIGDLAAGVLDALHTGGLCFGYHADLDLVGHLHGPGSTAWRMQLRQVDRLVASIVEDLPPGGVLAVVADHGMVTVDDTVVDADDNDDLTSGVRAIAGDVRARHVYAADGAAADVLATWREVLGDRALVISDAEAIAEGWFGPKVDDAVRPRIGDVIVAARDGSGVIRGMVEPVESSLRGHHGSMTTAEQLVPLLVAGPRSF